MPHADLNRLGGLEWTRATNGRLTSRERRRLLGEIVRGQAGYLAGRFRLATGRVPEGAKNLILADFRPPDSVFARTAEEACREQTSSLIGHGFRTWIFGSALAQLDSESIDPELFYVASLLHDYGLMESVVGEDFTLRSADRAERCAHDAEVSQDSITPVADAITVHITPGVRVDRDGALGTYLQAGATLDLLGIRAEDLTRSFRNETYAKHPNAGAGRDVARMIAAEAKAVRGGRFALLHRCGFNQLIRVSPTR